MLSAESIKYEVSEPKSTESGQLANQLKTRAFRFKIRVLVLSTKSIKHDVFDSKSKEFAETFPFQGIEESTIRSLRLATAVART